MLASLIKLDFSETLGGSLSPQERKTLSREAKFKRALRVHFLTHFTKTFCRFLTPKVKSGTDMINPSIESSDFLFWHKTNFEFEF
jgi:hypothetical protein